MNQSTEPIQPRTTLERIQQLKHFAEMAEASNGCIESQLFEIDPTTITAANARHQLTISLEVLATFQSFLHSHIGLINSIIFTIECDQ